MNDAWRYCDNLTDPEAARALAGACLTAHATITAFRRDGLDPDSVDWGFVLRELRAALKAAGHPAGAD
jgi:hypothetical protein